MDAAILKSRAYRTDFISLCLCGFIVLCACPSAHAGQVEVTSVSGTVEVLLEGADDYSAVQEGMILASGDIIKTSNGASAELSFNEANTNVVRLNENTDTKITLSGDEMMDVSTGEVFASVSDLPSGGAFEIRTPTAVSGARGTDWVTKVTDDGTDVEAVDSVPYVKHFETSGMKSSQLTLIQPGQMTTVKKFQPPMQPRPMNAARQQQWQSMKQQVRQRAGEAAVKRQQRPQFNRKDFIQQMKGSKEQRQGELKPFRSEDRPKQSIEQRGELKPLVSGENQRQEQLKQEQLKREQLGQQQIEQQKVQDQFKQDQLKQQQSPQPVKQRNFETPSKPLPQKNPVGQNAPKPRRP